MSGERSSLMSTSIISPYLQVVCLPTHALIYVSLLLTAGVLLNYPHYQVLVTTTLYSFELDLTTNMSAIQVTVWFPQMGDIIQANNQWYCKLNFIYYAK